MRLKSDIWVHALLRRTSAQGLFGAVVKRGAEEAGAIYVILNRLTGRYDLLGPPPGPSINEIGDRRFEFVLPAGRSLEEVNDVLARRRASDPDIWIVEIEDRTGFAGLQDGLENGQA